MKAGSWEVRTLADPSDYLSPPVTCAKEKEIDAQCCTRRPKNQRVYAGSPKPIRPMHKSIRLANFRFRVFGLVQASGLGFGVWGRRFRVSALGFRASGLWSSPPVRHQPRTTLLEPQCTHRLLSSSFLGLPYRILNMNHHKKELLRSHSVGANELHHSVQLFPGSLKIFLPRSSLELNSPQISGVLRSAVVNGCNRPSLGPRLTHRARCSYGACHPSFERPKP